MKRNFTDSELALVKATMTDATSVEFNKMGNIKILFPTSKKYYNWYSSYYHDSMRITKNDGKYVLRRITSDHPYVMFRNSRKTSGTYDYKTGMYIPPVDATPEDYGQFDSMAALMARYCTYKINKMNRA